MTHLYTNQNRKLKFRWVLAVIILGLLSRGVEDIFPQALGSRVNISNISAIFQYLVMFIGGWVLLHCTNRNLAHVFGKFIIRKDLLIGIGSGILLLAFTYGMNAWLVWIVAQWNPDFAYRFWNFRSQGYSISLPLTTHIILILNQFLVAPAIEEFMFRGLMYRSLSRYGLLFSISAVAVLFMILHLSQPYWISTLVFSILLSALYIKYHSLWPGIIAHQTFNTFAFVVQFHSTFHYHRSPAHLADLSHWFPEIIMFCASVPALVAIVIHCLRQAKECN